MILKTKAKCYRSEGVRIFDTIIYERVKIN
jgi:hypothetical protein